MYIVLSVWYTMGEVIRMEDTKKKKKSEYDVQYAKDNIKRVPLDMRKSDYEHLKEVAASCGEKVNEYIKKAIKQRMERDGMTENSTRAVGSDILPSLDSDK